MSNNAEQTPLCRLIRNTGDQGGEFIFIASSGAVVYAPSKSKVNAFLSVESNVKGARVLVDGRYIGSTDLSKVKVSTGEHRIRVEKDGYEAYIKRMNFEKGRSMSMFVVLNPKLSLKGRLYIDTQPGSAQVRILNIGPRFYQGMDIEAGRYHVEVSSSGYETEYAARAGSTTALANGRLSELKCGYDSNLDTMGWYCGNSNNSTHPVAQKQPNAWGLYDMHGNVQEWYQDWYGKNYPAGSVIDQTGHLSGSPRVRRSGGWLYDARRCRSAGRGWRKPGHRNGFLGFRLALSQLTRPGGCRSADPDKIPTLEIRGKKSIQCRCW